MSTRTMSTVSRISVRKLVVTALLGAVATVLMFISFGLPILPSYLKVDFSEMPALLASFALGPVYGAAVCLIKNLVNISATTTGGVGELCNFLLGVLFVVPAGLIYRRHPSRKRALIGMIVGTLVMSLCSVLVNYFVVYPVYLLVMPEEAIVGMYSAIVPAADSILKGILIFNMPLTFVKGVLDAVITFILYKRLSPVMKGREVGGQRS